MQEIITVTQTQLLLKFIKFWPFNYESCEVQNYYKSLILSDENWNPLC